MTQRILIITAGPLKRQIGGGQSYVQDLSRALLARGHDLCLFEPVPVTAETATEPVESRWQDMPLWSMPVRLPSESLEEQYSELGETRIARMEALIVRINPSVVQINGMMPTVVRACNNLGIPHLVVAHHPGEVCPKGDLLTPEDTICRVRPHIRVCGPCVLRCKKKGRGVGSLLARLPLAFYRMVGPLLTRFNPLGYLGRVLYIPWLTEQKLKGLTAFVAEAEVLVAPSAALGEALVRAGAPRDKLRVLHHGIQPVACVPLAPLGDRPLRLGFVGRIDHAKGLHVLLEALNLVNGSGHRVELHVHGAATNARDEAEWQRVLAEKANPRPSWFYLHGPFQRAAIATVYGSFDVLVLPSISPEAFGLAVAEGLSAGRPALVTDCGGPSEQIQEGVNGWIVPPNNSEALADRLEYLATHPAQVLECASNGPSSVKYHQVYVSEMEQLLSSKVGMP